MNKVRNEQRDWFREPMLWLVLGLPLAVVIAGFVTLALAISSGGSDSTPDPIRRVGKAQTMDVAADQLAAKRGLHAELRRSHETEAIEIIVDGAAVTAGRLLLQLTHPIHANQDQQVSLVRSGPSRYSGRLPTSTGHAWNLQLQPDDGSWRLQGRMERDALIATLAPALDDG